MEGIVELADRVRETAYAIHVFHGHGHLERIYENALVHRLRKLGLDVEQQCPASVFDGDGTLLGACVADLIVNRKLLIELKRWRGSCLSTCLRLSVTSKLAASSTACC
jgi:GxxExxY protein